MTLPLSDTVIARLFVDACDAELQSLKPGNVHIFAAGHRMEPHHFRDAAKAAAPFVADSRMPVGARIAQAVEASFAAAGCNTNLGILLLCTPLASAAQRGDLKSQVLRERLAIVLAELDRADAAKVFRAIQVANPAGLGQADEGDVHGPAEITLGEAMALAAHRDRIAAAFGNQFQEIFDVGLPSFQAALARESSRPDAISRLHMTFLATQPDSHIARKYDLAQALKVQKAAETQLDELNRRYSDLSSAEAKEQLLALDRDLKDRGLNPGTTADLVVATVFAEQILAQNAPACRG